MNAITQIEAGALTLVNTNPVLVLTDAEKFDAFYTAIAAEVRAHVADVTTKKGRDAVASLAFKVARTKTAIDDAGKLLNEDARKQINAVDAARRAIREKLDALRDEARKPLDEWEAADDARVAECRRIIDDIKVAGVIRENDDSVSVETRLNRLLLIVIPAAEFVELEPEAVGMLDTARATLQAAHARLLTQEAERAELAKLRAEAAERAERDRLADVEAARIEAERVAAERAEAKRIADAAAEAERIAAAERLAVQRERERLEAEEAAREAGRLAATREAERQAAEAQSRSDREHAAELARVEREKAAEVARIQREADEAEAARKAEVARLARIEADRVAAERAKAAEDERRAANARHRSHVMGKAKVALMEHANLDEETAKHVVGAIVAGNVPACSIQF